MGIGEKDMTDRTHPDSGRIITSGDVIAELQDRIAELESQLAAKPQEPVAWMDEFGNVFPLGAQRGPKHLNEPMKPLFDDGRLGLDAAIDAARKEGK